MLARPSQQIGMVVLGDRGKKRQPDVRPRRLLQQAGRLARAGPPDDSTLQATLRIGRGRGDAGLIQRHAVADRHVPRRVHHPDRQLGGDAIQILLGRVAPLCEHRVVVARAEDVFVLGRQPSEPPAQRLDDVVDRRDVAGRRRREIDPVELARDLREVTVAVDEAGDQRVTAEIHDVRPNAQPRPAPHRDRRPQGCGRPARRPLRASGCRSSIVTTSALTNTAVGSCARPGIFISREPGTGAGRRPDQPRADSLQQPRLRAERLSSATVSRRCARGGARRRTRRRPAARARPRRSTSATNESASAAGAGADQQRAAQHRQRVRERQQLADGAQPVGQHRHRVETPDRKNDSEPMTIATGFMRRTSIVVPAASSPSPENAAMTSGTASASVSQFARARSSPSSSARADQVGGRAQRGRAELVHRRRAQHHPRRRRRRELGLQRPHHLRDPDPLRQPGDADLLELGASSAEHHEAEVVAAVARPGAGWRPRRRSATGTPATPPPVARPSIRTTNAAR